MNNKAGVGTFVDEQFEMATDSLDLFATPQIETSQIDGRYQTYYPTGPLTDNGPFEFFVPSDGIQFLQLQNTRLIGQVSLVTAAGAAIADNAKTSIVNNFPQTLFRQIELSLNNTVVNDLSTPTYPFKAYIENHLSYDEDIKNTTLKARESYIADTAKQEEYSDANLALTTSGIGKRRAIISEGKKVNFNMLLHLDFLHIKKHLMPGVDLKLKLIRNDDNFSLLKDGAADVKIKFHKLELEVRQITIEPTVMAAIESKLSSTPAIYPFAHSKIKTFLLNSGIQSQVIPQIIRGKLPRSFIIGMVRSKAFDGDGECNPFKFNNFALNYIQVMVNGQAIHNRMVQPDWTGTEYLAQYIWFLENIGLHQNASNHIDMENYKENSCFFPYDLSPDLCNAYYDHGQESGTIDLHVGFKTALPENVTIVIYATYNENVTIDKNRMVTLM